MSSIKKAIEIISSDSVAGSGEKHLPTFVQLKRRAPPAALAQLRSGEQDSPSQQRASEFLRERAQVSGSHLLSMISQKVADDPFSKVKKMIKELVVKLMEEAASENEHKGWCDTELTTNKQTRDRKSEEIRSLSTELEDLLAEIAQLSQEVTDLTAGIAELDEAMSQATADRAESKAKNEATITDAKAAQTSVTAALAVLKDFYAKASEATALAQRDAVAAALTQQGPADDAPATSAPYQGQQASGGSVIDFLQVILSDFARLESETTSAERTEKDEYEKLAFESQKDKALKGNAVEHKSRKIIQKQSDVQTTKEELHSSQEQLSTAMAYYEKLKPSCVDSGISYEERVKRREEEIQSLKEALAMLEGNALA